MERENANEKIGTFDCETDPFLVGRIPHPFAAGIYFGDNDYAILWESDSKQDFVKRVIRALSRLPRCVLYAHNGGRFDFYFFLEAAKGPVQVRNGRIARMQIGNVILKDSFPLMPFPLETYRKTPIDYDIFERNRRNSPKNRRRIESYLLDDCRDLRDLLLGFRKIVGAKDTIGAAAFYQMRKLGIDIHSLNESHDEMFRPFYFGGRVQAFQHGVLKGPLRYIDANSAYPYAMLSDHAHGADYDCRKSLPKNPDKLNQSFVRLIADSKGALPLRDPNGGLSFPHCRDTEFAVTGWEIAAGIATRTLTPRKILEVWTPRGTINFSDYVKFFYAARLAAKRSGDSIGALAYKYLLNSGYGKFAQNPRDFKEYLFAPLGKNVPGFDWESDHGDVSLWSRPSYDGFGFFDVATGASITGKVRAMLWRAINASSGVAYCDTDAIVCRSSRVKIGDKLGAWKLEGIAKRVAIAGKKLYGVEWQKPQDGERYKIASKGARLTWPELLQVCNGKSIIWENAAPTFSINGASFIKREIRSTNKERENDI